MDRTQKFLYPGGNESGVVLIFSLVVLVILSLMAVFATSISTIETQTSTNNEKFQTYFLLGEGVTVEPVSLLKSETYENLSSQTPDLVGNYQAWLDKYNGVGYFENAGGPDLTDPNNWDTGTDKTTPTQIDQDLSQGGFLPPGFDSSAGKDRIMFGVQDAGIASGESKDTSGKTQVRAYHLYGLYDVGKNAAYPGTNLMEMGYKLKLIKEDQMPSDF